MKSSSIITDNVVLEKRAGAMSLEAGPKQLEKINTLYGKKITQAEFMRTIYPEALEVIPAEVLKEYEKVPVVYGQADTDITHESKLIDNNSYVQSGLVIVDGTSGRSGPANNLFHESKTVTTGPSNLSTTSTLEKNDNGSIVTVSSAYDFSPNAMLSYASNYYKGLAGLYRTVSYHVSAPPGHTPFSGLSYANTAFAQVN